MFRDERKTVPCRRAGKDNPDGRFMPTSDICRAEAIAFHGWLGTSFGSICRKNRWIGEKRAAACGCVRAPVVDPLGAFAVPDDENNGRRRKRKCPASGANAAAGKAMTGRADSRGGRICRSPKYGRTDGKTGDSFRLPGPNLGRRSSANRRLGSIMGRYLAFVANIPECGESAGRRRHA